MELFKKCNYCKKSRLFIKQWKLTLPVVKIKTMSKEKMCRSCFIKIKKHNYENIQTRS